MFFSKDKDKKKAETSKSSKSDGNKKEPVTKRVNKEVSRGSAANPIDKEVLDSAVTNFKKMMDDKRVKEYFKKKAQG